MTSMISAWDRSDTFTLFQRTLSYLQSNLLYFIHGHSCCQKVHTFCRRYHGEHSGAYRTARRHQIIPKCKSPCVLQPIINGRNHVLLAQKEGSGSINPNMLGCSKLRCSCHLLTEHDLGHTTSIRATVSADRPSTCNYR